MVCMLSLTEDQLFYFVLFEFLSHPLIPLAAQMVTLHEMTICGITLPLGAVLRFYPINPKKKIRHGNRISNVASSLLSKYSLIKLAQKKNDLCLSTLLCYISHQIVHVQMDSGNDFFWALIVTFWSPKLAIFWEHGNFSGFEVLLKIGPI